MSASLRTIAIIMIDKQESAGIQFPFFVYVQIKYSFKYLILNI